MEKMSVWRLVSFACVFMTFQVIWQSDDLSPMRRIWVDDVSVSFAAMILQAANPDLEVRARANHVDSPGGGIAVQRGCDGAELVWLLSAAFLFAPIGLVPKLIGWLVGLGLIVALNTGRFIGLFFAFRSDPALFDVLHNYALPLVLVVGIAAYFMAVLRLSQRPCRQQGM